MSEQETFTVTRRFIENVKEYAEVYAGKQQAYLDLIGENRPHLHAGLLEDITEAEDVIRQCKQMLEGEGYQ